jgi:hypothetical protein
MFLWRGTTLLTATRASFDAPFGVPAQDPNLADVAAFLSQSQALSTPSFTADARTLYAHYGGQGNNSIYVARRASPSVKFGAPTSLGVGVSGFGTDPFVSADGMSIYFDVAGDLYVAVNVADTFGEPVALRLVNSAAADTGPVLRADELELYYSSTRTDGASKGLEDIWVSKRASKLDEFGAPEIVEELDTSSGDYPSWVSADDCEIFLTYKNPDSKVYDVLSARRPL